MSNKTKNLVRAVANLDAADQLKVLRASDDELPEILKGLGIELPSTSWVLRIIKILLYAAGIILAGIGTTTTASAMISNIM